MNQIKDSRSLPIAGDRITGATRLLGLMADPVRQARSPELVNRTLVRRGLFGQFALVPFHATAASLSDVVTGFRRIENFCGAIVSMPHKATISAMLDSLTPSAELAGAVNVIRREPSGRLVGDILDGEAFVSGLRASGHEVAGKSFLLVGAGGAATAIALALAKHGCREIAIQNRTNTHASTLQERVQRAYPSVMLRLGSSSGSTPYDWVINATPLGMRDADPLPVSEDIIGRTVGVADCVVAPEVTRFIDAGRRGGRTVQTGLPMLTAQIDLLLDFMHVG